MLQLAEHLTRMRRQLSAHVLVFGGFDVGTAVSAVEAAPCVR